MNINSRTSITSINITSYKLTTLSKLWEHSFDCRLRGVSELHELEYHKLLGEIVKYPCWNVTTYFCHRSPRDRRFGSIELNVLNLIWKSPGFVQFRVQSHPLWSQTYHPCYTIAVFYVIKMVMWTPGLPGIRELKRNHYTVQVYSVGKVLTLDHSHVMKHSDMSTRY